MKKIILLAVLAITMNMTAQNTWTQFDKLMDDGSYKSAYEMAEKVYRQEKIGSERLAAAYHMALAAARYQEEARDSAEARYRELLPSLGPLEQALCHAFLGEYDQALEQAPVLQRTPVEEIAMYCDGEKSYNVTPTAYDVIMMQAMESGEATPLRRVEMERQLIEFHAGDGDDVRIWHELNLLNLLEQVPNHPLGEEQIKEVLDRYRDSKSDEVTRIYHRLASYYNGKGEYVKAMCCCDTAVARAPKSKGGVDCANLQMEIREKYIHVDSDGLVVASGSESLQRVRYRNVDKLWWRLIGHIEANYWEDNARGKILAAKSVASGEWNVEPSKEYRDTSSFVTLPALQTGRYLLLVSPNENFEADGFMAFDVVCTDMYLVKNGQGGVLLDRRTGHPIAGQKMQLIYDDYQKVKVLEKVTTDADGRYHFSHEEHRWGTKIVVDRGGYRLTANYSNDRTEPERTMRMQATVRTDRPIYKPGDTVSAAVVLYYCNGLDAKVAANKKVLLHFHDPNDEEVETKEFVTDDFGVVHATFLVPTDRLAGQYGLRVECESLYVAGKGVRVEEYKQPKFMVTLSSEVGSRSAEFGKPYTVQGLAASYSAVPVSGAKVKYTVNRREICFIWWRRWMEPGVPVEVASGELTTAADGSFRIAFVPEPDTNVELSHKPAFLYTVTAIVTDLNGESHEAVTTLRVGFRNAVLSLLDQERNVQELKRLRVAYEDLNSAPIDAEVGIRVERLLPPTTARLNHPLITVEGAHHTLGEEAWKQTFPLLNREFTTEHEWPVDKEVLSGTWKTSDGKVELELPALTSGTYRVTLTAADADTVTEEFTLTTPAEQRVQSSRLLWSDMDKSTVEVGEKVTLRFGSRFAGTEMYYLLRVGEGKRDFRRIALTEQIQHIDIPVDSTMLGGFQVDVFTLCEGILDKTTYSISVPFSHKQLKVDIATFRDKLLPGESEEWTVRVRSAELGVRSAMVMTMYDDALNSYESPIWSLNPWRQNSSSLLSFIQIDVDYFHWLNSYKQPYYSGRYPSVWTLKDALPRYHRMYKLGSVRNGRKAKSRMVYDEPMELESAEEMVMVKNDVVVTMQASVTTDGTSDAGGAQEPETLRTNLNTLAFFAPDLRTDEEGNVTYRFTVPDLLTRWSIRGLAFTQDLKTGTLDRTLVTQKSLMVQPNMPRFLRHGDSLSLMAKVINMTDEKREVKVDLVLRDAANEDLILLAVKGVTVPAQGSAQVTFDVDVPKDVYVAEYQITAQTEDERTRPDLPHYSDGERGQIPVVTNRQAVTLSEAVYINGAGEKHFAMPEWNVLSDSREARLVAAEVVSHPVWLAVKSMPYLESQESPSTIYLANQLYVNTMGSEVMKHVDIHSFAELNTDTTSRLKMNEDVKQTLLKATPWIRDAEDEEEQMRAVARYFDPDALSLTRSQTIKQLRDRQNHDGGWSWMPEGKSSLWVTQRVLQKVSVETYHEKSVRDALAYIDREQQQYYVRWLKPYLKKGYNWEPTDIDYLYTRSQYGKANTEAYKFYYSNALKHYKDCERLYTQAQLALIFHRNGDRKQALDLLRRLKEKSLVNDEMGMYWRDNTGSWYWYQRPIETQALLILAFAEITPQDTVTIGLMQQWLLKQKQTTHWGNDEASAAAIKALTLGVEKGKWKEGGEEAIQMTVFGAPLTAADKGREGYRSQRWTGAALDSLRALRDDDIVVRKQDEGIAWGAVYYQFVDDMDKIPVSETGITLKRTYIADGPLHVGDKIKVRIDISCDRTMEYLELIDGRPSCVEPLSTRAGWRWNEGLSYYITVNNTDTRCYIDRLEKGKYYFEYEVFVTNPGRFLAAPVVMQCMYAPEFRAIGSAEYIEVQ